MVSYDFYVNTYMGSILPEQAFKAAAARAREVLEYLCRVCRVEGGEEAKAMAVCAMAEAIHTYADRRGILSSKVGEVSVRYGEKDTLNGELYRRAGIYLDIYRGV